MPLLLRDFRMISHLDAHNRTDGMAVITACAGAASCRRRKAFRRSITWPASQPMWPAYRAVLHGWRSFLRLWPGWIAGESYRWKIAALGSSGIVGCRRIVRRRSVRGRHRLGTRIAWFRRHRNRCRFRRPFSYTLGQRDLVPVVFTGDPYLIEVIVIPDVM